MYDFLGHATGPDGLYARIGDTPARAAVLFKGTSSEYAASLGTRGMAPKEIVKVYPQSGYAFGRSGWGKERPFNKESFYSVHYGPGRFCHGHNDHTSFTYMAKGQDIIVDSGFTGYNDKKERGYLQSLKAHNVVYVNDNRKFNWQNNTDLLFFKDYGLIQCYSFRDIPYANVERKRTLLFDTEYDIVIIYDSIFNPRSDEYCQIFHFDYSFDIKNFSQELIVLNNQELNIYFKQLFPFTSVEIYKGKCNEYYSFMSDKNNRRADNVSIITKRKNPDTGPLTYLTVICVNNCSKFNAFSKKQNDERLLTIQTSENEFSYLIMKNMEIAPYPQ